MFDPVAGPDRGGRRQRNVTKMDLWKEAEVAKASANMLVQALGFTPVEDLDSNSLIQVRSASSPASGS
jgi:hypothetical protein